LKKYSAVFAQEEILVYILPQISRKRKRERDT